MTALLTLLTLAFLIAGGAFIYWLGRYGWTDKKRTPRTYLGIASVGIFLAIVVPIAALFAMSLFGQGLVAIGLISEPKDDTVGLLAFFAIAPLVYLVVFAIAIARSSHEAAT